MSETKPMKGKDADCGLYDCPHKKNLSIALDEIAELENKNQELNSRLETIDNMISQGLTDFKGLLKEILKDKDITPEKIEDIGKQINRVFDTGKITDIINENLNLRRIINSKNLEIAEITSGFDITKQQKEALEINIKAREEKDLNLIKQLRTTGIRSEEQLKEIEARDAQIKKKEMQLKALEDFIVDARKVIIALKEEHEGYLKDNKELRTENKFIAFTAKANLTKLGKKTLRLIKVIKRLKYGRKGLMLRFRFSNPKRVYEKVKDLYYDLNNIEKSSLSNEFDEVARLMGE